jgi:hypothetical protein
MMLLLALFCAILIFYRRREYFAHSSNYPRVGKTKLSAQSLRNLLAPPSRIASNRYQQLYDSGVCSAHFLPPAYFPGRGRAPGNIKYCQCDQGSGVSGGLVPARNMPNAACSKNDFTRGGTA